MSADPRSRAQRRRDTEHRLTHDIDVWVASASADGAPYLVPLSFDWDGEALLVATPTDSPTGRNLAGRSGGRHSSVLKQPEDVAVGVGDGGHQATTTDVVRGLLHGGTRGGHLGQLRLDVRHVPVRHR